MPSSTKQKAQSYVESIAWGSASVSHTTEAGPPVKQVWKASSTNAFQIAVSHTNEDGDQAFNGKTITVTLCEGVYTFEAKD